MREGARGKKERGRWTVRQTIKLRERARERERGREREREPGSDRQTE